MSAYRPSSRLFEGIAPTKIYHACRKTWQMSVVILTCRLNCSRIRILLAADQTHTKSSRALPSFLSCTFLHLLIWRSRFYQAFLLGIALVCVAFVLFCPRDKLSRWRLCIYWYFPVLYWLHDVKFLFRYMYVRRQLILSCITARSWAGQPRFPVPFSWTAEVDQIYWLVIFMVPKARNQTLPSEYFGDLYGRLCCGYYSAT
jgi:hypothetical protein